MADVRALLAAERQSRRIAHPHLSYSKSGALTCTACNLNIRSEQLWPGHLKSLNHRKNVQKSSTEPSRPAKRKIESVEAAGDEERNYEVDSRKKPKPISQADETRTIPQETIVLTPIHEETATVVTEEADATTEESTQQTSNPPGIPNAVDEDEWAAFEREVAPLAQDTYAAATIEAAPVSAAEVIDQQKTNPIQERENEAEAEKEDESRRLEDEFEIMEEMEDRVKRLRARREALRPQEPQSDSVPVMDGATRNTPMVEADDATEKDLSEEEEEDDDWYG